jgi:CxxC-x17-CxxC domain-containing protein
MTATLTDLVIHCADCGDAFVFTIGEQLFYAERGLAKPNCCPECRARRRSARNGEAIRACEGVSASTQSGDGFGNYGGASGGGRKGIRSGVRMYSVVCSACGRATEVPFEPRGGRPVYCRDCFNSRRGR